MSEDKDKLWLEDEIQRELKLSAEEQPVPEALLPENVVARLKEEQQASRKKQGKKLSRYVLRVTELAAAIALVIAIGGIGRQMLGTKAGAKDSASNQSVARDTAGGGQETVITNENAAACEVPEGHLDGYQVASSYDDVYALIEQSRNFDYFAIDDGMYDIAEAEGAEQNFAKEEVAESASGGTDYSSTNVQQEGVDESDIAKTDGDFIYKVTSGNTVDIIDIRDNKMKRAYTIRPEMGAVDRIVELFVDGNRLYVIVSRTEAELAPMGIEEDIFYWNNHYQESTMLLTYDITSRSNPQQISTFTQDGAYYTSRKVGNYIYLFTRNDLYSYYFDDEEDAIPYVQNKKVKCEDIYIADCAYTELIIASVDTRNTRESVDEVVIVDDYSQIYMGNSAIYLYKYAYQNDREMTQIAKFSYEDGEMNPVASTLVNGSITDTFAISEKNGMLRVLTSDWNSGERINQLYILDDQLQVTGEIQNIAEGESVYAARYIGDIAYFITYRNMDPLFVADLSDAKNPVLLGSVEVTGFSDYLHLYEDNLVLGIGYETDENSIREGVKLCMFDVSDPLNPQVKNSFVLEEAAYTNADYNYKSILVDAGKGVIGFITESWQDEYVCEYHVFTWTGEAFEELLCVPLSENGRYEWSAMDTRGLYAGEIFYLAGSKKVTSYDMARDFAKLDELELASK